MLEFELINEFERSIKDLGLILKEPLKMEHFNGSYHRIDTIDGKRNNKAGAFRGFLNEYNGRLYLNGSIKNFKTGAIKVFNSKNYFSSLNDNEKKEFNQQIKKEILNSQRKIELMNKDMVSRIKSELKVLSRASNHIYLKNKKLNLDFIDDNYRPFLDKNGNLLIEIINPLDSSLKGIQRISTKGLKLIEKHSFIKGNCAYIPKRKDNEFTDYLFISTGYATSLSINQATSKEVYCALYDNNSINVVENLIKKFGDTKKIIFFADNDFETEKRLGINSGKNTAVKLNQLFNVESLMPSFNNEELNDFSDFLVKYGEIKLNDFINLNLKNLSEKKEFLTTNGEKIMKENETYTENEQQKFDGYRKKGFENLVNAALAKKAVHQRSYNAGELHMPRMMSTGREFVGANAIDLLQSNPNSEFWVTYDEAKNMGKGIKKGANSIQTSRDTLVKTSSFNSNNKDDSPDWKVEWKYFFPAEDLLGYKAKPLTKNYVSKISAENSMKQLLEGSTSKVDIKDKGIEEILNEFSDEQINIASEETKNIETKYGRDFKPSVEESTLSSSLLGVVTAAKYGLPYVPKKYDANLANSMDNFLEEMKKNPGPLKNVYRLVNRASKNIDFDHKKLLEKNRNLNNENSNNKKMSNSKEYADLER